MNKSLEFSHLHIWVGDVDAFKRRCEEMFGWRTRHYAPGIVVEFDDVPGVAFENGVDHRFQLAVKSLDATAEQTRFRGMGLAEYKPLVRKNDGRVQAWLKLDEGMYLEVEENLAHDFSLVPPHSRYRDTVLEAAREMHPEGWMLTLDPAWKDHEFSRYVEDLEARRQLRNDTQVPDTTYWAVCNGEYLGRITVRHEINIWVGSVGGHVGYEVRPKFRRRGLGAAMLKKFIPILRDMNFVQVLITCDEDNLASRKVAESAGARYAGLFSPADASLAAKMHYVLDLR